MSRTRKTKLWPAIERAYAAGLHLEGTAQTALFDEFCYEGRPVPYVAIGRSTECHIRIDNQDRAISEVHAILERRGELEVVLCDSGSTNGILVDGEPLDGPVVLRVGMQVALTKHTSLWGVDVDRLVPFAGTRSIDELCFRAWTMYGSYREVERRFEEDGTRGIGREFIQAHAEAWARRPHRRA